MKDKQTKALGFNLLMINTFIYVAFSLYAPFLSPYYAKKGISSVQIGILLTIAPVLAILIQPLWGLISDRTGRRKDILSFVAIGCGLSMFSYYIGNTFLTFFIATVLLSIFSNSLVPLSDAIILRNAKKYNLDFAKIRMGGTVGFAIVVIIAGRIIKQYPSSIFFLGFIGFFILFLFVRGLPKEENAKKNVPLEKTKKKRKWNDTLNIFETKQVYFVLAFAFISFIGLSFNNGFLGVYLLELGYEQNTIGWINSVAALSEIPILLIINKLVKKLGAMKVIIASCFLLGIRFFIITGGNLYFVVLGQMLHGVTYMTLYFSCAVFIAENVKKENQSQGQSILAIIQLGISSILGNVVGGYLAGYLGLRSTYFTLSIMTISCCALVLLILKAYQKKCRI